MRVQRTVRRRLHHGSEDGRSSGLSTGGRAHLEQESVRRHCGAVCPDTHCMAPARASSLTNRSRSLGASRRDLARRETEPGAHAGPAGQGKRQKGSDHRRRALRPHGRLRIGAARAQGRGLRSHEKPGGALNLIPAHRLSREIVKIDLDFIFASKLIKLNIKSVVKDPTKLKDFDAILCTVRRYRAHQARGQGRRSGGLRLGLPEPP